MSPQRASRRRRPVTAASRPCGKTGCPIESLEGRVLFSTYTVTTLGDSAGTVTANGTGKFNATTLRAALNAANAHAGADVINFAAGLAGAITLGSALPAVNDTLTLLGPGASKLAIQRSATAATDFSILHVNAGKTASAFGLTLTKGTGDPDGSGPGFGGNGGGVFNAGTLTLANCTLTANATTGFSGGGGVYNTGKLTLNGCTLSGNSANYRGGGIYSTGSLALAGSTLSGNSAYFAGGGIYSVGSPTTVSLSFCTLSNTRTAGGGLGDGGGGIFRFGPLTAIGTTFAANAAGNAADQGFAGGGGLRCNGGTVTLSGCTFSGNSAAIGGGVYVDSSATVNAADCTFAANKATFGPGGGVATNNVVNLTNCTLSGNSATLAGGGGVGNYGTLTLSNTIVVGNVFVTGTTSKVDEIYGKAAPASTSNVVGTAGTGGLLNGVNGNKVGVSLAALKLGTLASNGGKAQTFALLAGSPAINAGSNAAASAAKLFADQRGLPRVSGGRTDVGAYELQGTGGSIAGTFFNDTNHDGARQSTEPVLVGWQVYLDQNLNGVYDAGEQTTFTGSTGAYKFTGLAAGTYRVREVRPDPWVRSKPAGVYPLGYYDVTINLSVNGGAVGGKDFGNYLA
jgi:predicted outer membrane repeat protein